MGSFLAKMCACTSKHVFICISRQPPCEYEENFERLEEKQRKLQGEADVLLRSNIKSDSLTGWETKWVEICNKVQSLRRDRRDLTRGLCCNWFCNVQQSCKHRFTVALVLKDIDHLDEEFKESVRMWKYKIKIIDLKKKVEEDLEHEKERVMGKIKDEEEPLSDVQTWLGAVDDIVKDLSEMISHLQSDCPQACKTFCCRKCIQREDVAADKANKVDELLDEAKAFTKFSREKVETVYKRELRDLQGQVHMLRSIGNDVQRRMEADGEPNEYDSWWLGEARRNADEVSKLTAEYSHIQHKQVTELSKKAEELHQRLRYVSHQAPSNTVNYQSPTCYTSQSRELILNREDDQIQLKNTADSSAGCSYLTPIAGR